MSARMMSFSIPGLNCVSLSREGHERIELDVEQTTPHSVSRAFSLQENTVWLKEEGGSRAFFPDGIGERFVFSDDVPSLIANFIVEGCPLSAGDNRVSSGGIHVPTTGNVTVSSFGQNVTRPFCSSTRRNTSASVKVMQAKILPKRAPNGRLEFVPLNQAFVEVNETTANVNYISMVIRTKWGKDYVLVTADGLRIDDSSGTQGLKFWKVGSRKVYAVKQSDARHCIDRKRKTKALRRVSSSSSDEDDSDEEYHVQRRKKRKVNVADELKGLRESMKLLVDLSQAMEMPIAMLTLLNTTFKCHICQGVITPPVMFSKCCKSIMGCKTCTDEWYHSAEGVARSCPKCRAERAFNDLCHLRGLDDFLVTIKSVLSRESIDAVAQVDMNDHNQNP